MRQLFSQVFQFPSCCRTNLTRCSASPVIGTIRGGAALRSRGNGTGFVPLIDANRTGFTCQLEVVCHTASLGAPTKINHVVNKQVVELVYVLSGTGFLIEATGTDATRYPLQPGSTLAMWAGTTHMLPATTESNENDAPEPLAALRFQLPLSMLNPANPDISLAKRQLRELMQQQATAAKELLQETETKTLSDSDAEELLHAGHAHSHSTPILGCSALNAVSIGQSSLLHHIDDDSLHETVRAVTLQALQHAAKGSISAAAVAALISWSHSPNQNPHNNTAGFQYRSRSTTPEAMHPADDTAMQTLQRQLSERAGNTCVLLAKTMEDYQAFQFPRQTNQLAFVFDPRELGLPLSFGVEVFGPKHHTPIHVHQKGYEFFFVLIGEGDAYCDGQHFHVKAGDCIVFPPGSKHGLDNNTDQKMYTLQLMCPDDMFTAYVQTGTALGHLDQEDICQLTARGC